MNQNTIFSAYNISFSQKEESTSYSASQILQLFLRAKQQGNRLILPCNCSETELDTFTRFISNHEEALRGTKKGLPYEFYRGESLFSEDEKNLYLFIFTNAQVPVMLKGILRGKRKITYLLSGNPVQVDEVLEPWNGADTLWLQLNSTEIQPICTVLRLASPEPIKLCYSTGIHLLP